ncbi:MAG TPA: SURF1 family protein [Acidimicrobiia bacterium]|jgi:surfeit locus 1 family protein|nr:SURF1 family protein [Acidimicrobiia bacterium]
MDAPDYSFLRRPVWLVGHLVALAAIVGFTLLGMWQLSRHSDRSSLDDALDQRLNQPVVSLDELVGADGTAPSSAEYRLVSVEGSYDATHEVILQARSFNGRSGHEVLTPLVRVDGTAVIVNRGWVPIDVEGPPVPEAAPPAGAVIVEGFLRQTQTRTGLGPIDPSEGTLERISRVDVERLRQQVEMPLAGVWIQLASQQPPPSDLPLIVEPPQPGGGPPHLAYAVQWFAFAVIVVVSYPVLMYRTARRSTPRG